MSTELLDYKKHGTPFEFGGTVNYANQGVRRRKGASKVPILRTMPIKLKRTVKGWKIT